MASVTQGLANVISTIASSIKDLATDIINIIKWLATALLDGIKAILVEIFVPQEDYLSDKINAIRDKFSFADSVMGSVGAIQQRLNLSTNSTPPSVTFKLSSYEGSFNYGKDVTFSMDWFSRYKPTTDALLSGVLWMTFIWKVFVRLPSIINGVSSASGDMMRIDNYDVNDRRTWGGKKA